MDLPLMMETVLLSMKIGLLAILLNLPLSLAFSFVLNRILSREIPLLEGIINLPLVMPPVTTGYLLLFLLGKRGVVGSLVFHFTGHSIAYSSAAALIASMIVSFPLLIRSVRTAMDMVNPRLENAAKTLGANPLSVYFRVTFPLILPGVLNGALVGFARSLGEFGATITFAGNIAGETRTIPLAVYSLLQVPGKEREAAVLVLFSIGISFMSLFLSSRFNRGGAYGARI